jgi:hypothetical protein
MKRFLITTALAAATITTSAFAADVGVSISVGQPGFYGQLDIGNFPQPQVINPQPVFIEDDGMNRPPLYLRVPPKYVKHWKKHCHEYNACGRRVFFVRDDWYNREYVPRYQEQHRDHQEARHEEPRNQQHEERRDEHRDEHRDDHRDDHREDRR